MQAEKLRKHIHLPFSELYDRNVYSLSHYMGKWEHKWNMIEGAKVRSHFDI